MCLELYFNCIYNMIARIRYYLIAHISSHLNQIMVIFLQIHICVSIFLTIENLNFQL